MKDKKGQRHTYDLSNSQKGYNFLEKSPSLSFNLFSNPHLQSIKVKNQEIIGIYRSSSHHAISTFPSKKKP